MKTLFMLSLMLIALFGCKETTAKDAAPPVTELPGLSAPKLGDFMLAFGGPRLLPEHRNANIDYRLDPNRELFYVHVPQNYSDDGTYGLIIFIHSGDDPRGVPVGWGQVLNSRKYLFVAPQNSGNDHDADRRLGLAVMGALKMMKHYRINKSRVYAAGFSGGARMAGLLGFYQSDVFHGTIQNCGADFYRIVPLQAATSRVSTSGSLYGELARSASPNDIASAKKIHFALITGTNDFRRGNILDIYNGGFKPDGFHARLFDVAGMEHDIADGKTLVAVLDYLEAP